MRLRVLEQIHISSIRSDTLRPGEVIDVNDMRGEDLLATMPAVFAAAIDPAPAADIAAEPTKPKRKAK